MTEFSSNVPGIGIKYTEIFYIIHRQYLGRQPREIRKLSNLSLVL